MKSFVSRGSAFGFCTNSNEEAKNILLVTNGHAGCLLRSKEAANWKTLSSFSPAITLNSFAYLDRMRTDQNFSTPRTSFA